MTGAIGALGNNGVGKYMYIVESKDLQNRGADDAQLSSDIAPFAFTEQVAQWGRAAFVSVCLFVFASMLVMVFAFGGASTKLEYNANAANNAISTDTQPTQDAQDKEVPKESSRGFVIEDSSTVTVDIDN